MPEYKENNRVKVRKLWEVCSYCHWCNRKTVIQKAGETIAKENTATFDHLYHKSEPERKTKEGKNKGVLSCFDCNQKRGRKHHIKTLPFWHRFLIKINLHNQFFKIKRKAKVIRKRIKNGTFSKRDL